jgi:hypothetical protein
VSIPDAEISCNPIICARFVAFVSGSFAAVLFLATVLDPDVLVHFEITPHRTVLFYLGVFGSILAVARGMIPEDNRVFDPEMLMTETILYTHYMPDSWKDQLHSKKVNPFVAEKHSLNDRRIGSSGVWGTISNEDLNIHTRDPFRRAHSIYSLVLTPTLCACHNRFFPGVYCSCGWQRLRL